MPNYNKYIQVGHLVRDIESNTVTGGLEIAKLTVATTDKYGEKETTAFVDWTVFGKSAESIVRFFKKGDAILLEGKLQTDSWEDKDGNKRSKLCAIASNWTFVSSKSGASNEYTPKSSGDQSGSPAQEEVPF